MSRKKRKKEKIVYGVSPEMLAAHRERLAAIKDATDNPEKRIWTDEWKRLSRVCPMVTSLGTQTVGAIHKLQKEYISRGWMNEKGEWIN